jgi:hypothetical protein
MGITPSINSQARMEIVEFRTKCDQTNQRYEDRKAVPRRTMGIVWSMALHAVNITTPMVVPKKTLLSLISPSVAGDPLKSLGRKVTIILPFAEGSGSSVKGQSTGVMQRTENGALGPDYVVEGGNRRLHKRPLISSLVEIKLKPPEV